MDLTAHDISILIDALQVWEKQPATEASMKGIFEAIFDGMDPEKKDLPPHERERLRQNKRRASENEMAAGLALRRETSILLQAKLIKERIRFSEPI
jgi:hypothetical protein